MLFVREYRHKKGGNKIVASFYSKNNYMLVFNL